jgi:putative membrane protein
MTDATEPSAGVPFDPRSITRPDPSLMTYYLLASACTVVAFPILIIPQLIRYKTLRYSFDDKGLSMSWGILFRKEITLTYRRIQDIHVTRNIIERWMGLAKVAIQTASGTSGAEMTVEGLKNPEALRDFLYQRMRGAREGDEHLHEHDAGLSADASAEGAAQTGGDEALALLTDIRDELRRIRETSQEAGR